ncbi:DUF948 domain-containing protein [Streptomyces sp. NPDC127574]|uniref:DUF948 domain-containing protein n=1 Tax=Streptomyces sp. NPDC127574 TaxID=3345401 RepID=UPI0036310C74
MTGGEVAGILVAVFWAILVSFLAVALARLAQTLRATTKLVADVTEQAVPLLADASAAVRAPQTQIDRTHPSSTPAISTTDSGCSVRRVVVPVPIRSRGCMGHHQGQPQDPGAEPREPRGAGRQQGDRRGSPAQGLRPRRP